MDTNNPTRRALLGAAAIAPVIGLIPVTAIASANGAEWYRLKAQFDVANAKCDHYGQTVRDPAVADARRLLGGEALS